MNRMVETRVPMNGTGPIAHGRVAADPQVLRLLARDGTHKIVDIAYDCGFGDVSHFNRRFRRRFGAAPSKFRNAHAAAAELPDRAFPQSRAYRLACVEKERKTA
jgi:hypothetical protein